MEPVPISCVTVPVCTPAIPDVRAKQYTVMSEGRGFLASAETSASLPTCWSVRLESMWPPRDSFDSDTKWAAGAGGSMDYKWRGPFSWRVQADYLRLNVFGTHQNMIRASTGLVVRF